MPTLTDKELQDVCKQHFQMGVQTATTVGMSAEKEAKRDVHYLQEKVMRLQSLIDNFEKATGSNLKNFREKTTLNLVKYLLSIKGDKHKLRKIIATRKKVAEAFEAMEKEVREIVEASDISLYDEDRWDYLDY